MHHLLLLKVPLLQERKHQSPSPRINLLLHPPQIRIMCSDNPNERLSKAPVLLLGDSIIRGIQQRKFAPNRYVNKQTIAGGTREISQYINHMQERNDYDYIVIHSGTNDLMSGN